MLNIDGTVILQIANFLALLFILNFILFKPIRKILARREEEMASRLEMIHNYEGRAERSEKDIEEGQVQARKEGYASKETLKSQGLEDEKRILQEAGAAVEQKLDAAKKEIEAKVAAAKEALEAQIAGFSEELAQKILGRSIQ
ncbi:MAG: F-type H+-transporting ATPase subunit b [Thermodesulfobacteriota bacterium]|nr:F-type H+-transporting ATPase subunit b [Thermodesulfobacteriota bacterium]